MPSVKIIYLAWRRINKAELTNKAKKSGDKTVPLRTPDVVEKRSKMNYGSKQTESDQ